MPRVIPPAPRPIKTDIELFARAYFNLELTSAQMQYIAMVAAGTKPLEGVKVRKMGLTTANKVIRAYLQAGIITNGRARLPQHPLPPRPDLKAHEEVHVTRQGDDPQAWWDKYLVDTDFRLQEELVAYQVQYKYMEVHYDRAKRRAILSSIAKDLSGPMYGGIINKEQAIRLIKNGGTL